MWRKRLVFSSYCGCLTRLTRLIRFSLLGLLGLLGLTCLWSDSLFASRFEDVTAPNRIGVSHTEGSGPGYSIGYTSLDLFFSQIPYQQIFCQQSLGQQALVPFMDIRGHLFNNGKKALNAGVGFRCLRENENTDNRFCFPQVWGINAFYDHLETKKGTYNQVGIGVEALGEQWDLLANAYLPVGRTKRNIYKFSYNFLEKQDWDRGCPTLNFLLKARERLAMSGVDLSLRYRYCVNNYLDATLSLGPYVYRGRSAKTRNAFYPKHVYAYGGQLRACFSWRDYILLKGISTYDTQFKWNGQIMLALNVPFDIFCKTCRTACCKDTCATSDCLQRLVQQQVQRNEIIVVDSIHRHSTDPQVLDPENPPN